LSKVISAGILLEHDGKFLIGHPTEMYGTTNGWGILKGKMDKGETLYEAALREFKEESNLNLLALPYALDCWFFPRPFYSYQVKNKTVYVFWVIDKTGIAFNSRMSCPSIIEGTDKPEIDAYKWVTPDEAIKIVAESQIDLFQTVKALTKLK
jgi:8-oxo-dGTP pyrophosphatase MutT (NUDIX family)